MAAFKTVVVMEVRTVARLFDKVVVEVMDARADTVDVEVVSVPILATPVVVPWCRYCLSWSPSSLFLLTSGGLVGCCCGITNHKDAIIAYFANVPRYDQISLQGNSMGRLGESLDRR